MIAIRALSLAAGVCCAALALPAQAALTPWTAASTLTFPDTEAPPPVGDLIQNSSAEYLWYCGQGVPSCRGDRGPTQVEFRNVFQMPALRSGYFAASISLLADDYYALYVNGQLVGSNWLDDVLATTNPVADTYDIAGYLLSDISNEIQVFACDGYPPGTNATDRLPPGATPSGGWAGCTTPSNRVNHWLLVDGSVVPTNSNFPTQLVSLRGAEGSNWEVRAVPEPATLPLLLAAVAILSRRRPASPPTRD
jgi:hypothetical protein